MTDAPDARRPAEQVASRGATSHSAASPEDKGPEAAARAALLRFGVVDATLTRITVGLINQTWRVDTADGPFVLQRVNPIFGPAVHRDIEAITARLAAHGVLTPRLVRTTDDALCAETAHGVYRLMTYIDGEVVSELTSPTRVASMARLVARFHAALDGFAHTFAFTRPGPHDTPRHLAFLEATLRECAEHPQFGRVRPVAEAILAHGRELPALGQLPRRIIHGDLKITNLMFRHGTDDALAILDLDTMAHDTLAAEMGDALRSWCNPAGESEERAELDMALYRAAVDAYVDESGPLLRDEERAALPAGLETIALELASRFCADALRESYFGWDATRFTTRTEHNLVRARSQLSLAASVRGRLRDTAD
ncbi:MAG: phosphotransferase [Sandaracinaceae bacterium]|nr:phosphotransferase [Sandaracinaceae bacterium]